MSRVPVDAVEEVCANCSKEGSDAVTLKKCNACSLVKYCSVDCQKVHRKLHKKACKKRAAEIKDEKLYGQGHERVEADFCPICYLAIPFPMEENATFRSCCMKLVCNGCILAVDKKGLGNICPFCRTTAPKTAVGIIAMIRKRVAARDPTAICHLGDMYANGSLGLQKDVSRGVELWSEAADLGSIRALHKMGRAHAQGVLAPQDEAKGIRCRDSAAMKGCVESRHLLGVVETENRNYGRAVRHFLISAKMGHPGSLDFFKEIFSTMGFATKAQYAEALKGYQDAVEETKSPERVEAAKIRSTGKANQPCLKS